MYKLPIKAEMYESAIKATMPKYTGLCCMHMACTQDIAAVAPVIRGIQVVRVLIDFLLISAWLCEGCEERAQGARSKGAKASSK